jgi:hypothetical protein
MELASYGTQPWATTYNNFGPRIGLAYQLAQNAGRETVVRGGFGVFFDTGNAQGASGLGGPYQYPFSLTAARPGLSYPLNPAVVAPLTLPDPRNLVPPYGSVAVFDPNLKLPYTLQWSFAVQQSLGKEQALTLTYVGNSGRRLLQQRQINLTGINPKFTIIGLTTNNATSGYNALQAQFQRRLSRGLQVLASYTWSHALDFDSTDNGTLLPVYGNSFYDVRHNFSSALTYDIPMPSDNPFVGAVFARWSIDSTFLARTGLPIDLVARQQVNPADGSLAGVRPNLIAGQPLYIYSSALPGGRRINPAALSVPAVNQFGNLGRNVFRALGMWQQDLALRREFRVTEKVRVQFRAEAFNIFNHPNFGTYQITLGTPNFGQATAMLNQALAGAGSAGKLSSLYASGGPRSMQFALRISF